MKPAELLKDALNNEWAVPGYDRHKIPSGCTDRIDNLVLFRIFIEGAFTRKQISPGTGIVPQLNKLEAPLFIGAKPLNRLYCLDLLYEQLSTHGYMDSDVMNLLYGLRPAIIQSMLYNDSFITSARHPLRKILDDICSWGAGWDKNIGKNGERYFSLLQSLADTAASIDDETQSTPDIYTTHLNSLNELVLRYKQAETRLCESNQATMESLRVRRTVEHTINTSLEKKSLPPQAIKFFHGIWRDVLHRIMAVHGDNSKDWLAANQLMEKLIFCLSPGNGKEERQKQIEMIPTLFPPLEKFLHDIGDLDGKVTGFDDLGALLQKALIDENIPVEPVTSLSSLGVDGVAVSISSAISQQVTQLKPGQWVLYTNEEGELARARLAMISQEAGQLLFVNLLGGKPFSKSMEELGFALATRKAHAIVSKNLSNILLTITVDIFTKQYQKQKAPSPETNSDASRELRRQSAEKALAEAKKLQVDQQTDNAENETAENVEEIILTEKKTDKQLDNDERPHIESLINSIEIGSWLSMKNRYGEKIPCKVAIVYARTGKMIIVDKLGMRIGEFSRQDLVQLIMDGEASILELSDSFEASLSRVLQTLRKNP